MSSKVLSVNAVEKLLNTIIDKLHKELMVSNRMGEIEKFLEKFNLQDCMENAVPSYGYVDFNNSRILVLAFSFHKVDVLKIAAKKIGFDPRRIDFEEYKSSFNYNTLRFSSRYSDVIIGPVPHMGIGIDGASSFLALADKCPQEFPKIHRMEDSNGNLKVSKNGFELCLKKTVYFAEIIA